MKSFRKDKIVYQAPSPIRVDDDTVAQVGPDGIVHGYDKSIADSDLFKQLEAQTNIMTKIGSRANAEEELSASEGWFTQEQDRPVQKQPLMESALCSPCNLYDLAPGVFLIVSSDNPIPGKKIQALMQLLSD